MKFLEKLPQPTTLGNHMSNDVILCFCAGTGDCGLTLGGPRNQIVAEEDTVAGGGTPTVRAACPIRI
jgi:hypothetical protein